MNDQTKSPRNTAADPELNGLLLLADAMGGGNGSRFIEEQERAGQSEVVNSTTLPSDLKPSEVEPWEALGFTLGEPVDGDPMFRAATLPEGWKREGSDHAMWSYVVDQHGRRRVSIFYKAAFYDRKAHAHIDGRHSYIWDCVYNDQTPILDDEWLPLTRALSELEDLARQEDDRAERWVRLDPDSEFIAENRAKAAKARAMAERLTAGGSR